MFPPPPTNPPRSQKYPALSCMLAKTALAAVLALLFGSTFSSFRKVIGRRSARIGIVMYSDVSKTMKASGQRLVGTAIGVGIGGAFAAITDSALYAFGGGS